MYAEQYVALHPHSNLHGNHPHAHAQNGHINGGVAGMHLLPSTPSRYNITPYDLHSDISIAKMAAQQQQQTPVHPSLQPMLTQNHLHQHNLQNQGLDLGGGGHYYSTYDNC